MTASSYFEVPASTREKDLHVENHARLVGELDYEIGEVVKTGWARWGQIVVEALAAAGILLIFAVETLSSAHYAFAVLYIASLTIVSRAIGNHRVLLTATFITILQLLSWVWTDAGSTDPMATAKLCSGIFAVWTACIWILWHSKALEKLSVAKIEASRSEELFRTVFEHNSSSIFELDYYRVQAYLVDLRAEGVSDLESYSFVHPEFLIRCISQMQTNRTNSQARQHFSSLLLTDRCLIGILRAIFEGEPAYRCTISFPNSTIPFRLEAFFPSDRRMFDRVVIILTPMPAPFLQGADVQAFEPVREMSTSNA